MKLNSFSLIASNLPDELYQEFKWALKSGFWRCGLPMSERQRTACQQTVLLKELQLTSVNTKH